MSNLPFYLTDVFATERYSGNQLATFVDVGSLNSREMQRIAIEMNYSETTFVLSTEPRAGGFDVRIFTPAEEVDFAGHPTIGTAFVLRRFYGSSKDDRIVLNLKVGPIPVEFDQFPDGDVWMEQHAPTFGPTIEPEVVRRVLSLPAGAILPDLPVCEVSTGLAFCIVPLRSMDHLKSARVDWQQYHLLLEHTSAKGILAFAPGGYTDEQDYGVRVFVPLLGIPEDPATGSGNGCLAGYLVKHGATDRIEATVGQGYEIGRPSRLRISSSRDANAIRVRVGGRIRAVGEGTLY